MQLTPNSTLHLLEKGRGENFIKVCVSLATGELARVFEDSGSNDITGEITADRNSDVYYQLSLLLKTENGERVLDLTTVARLLMDDQAFFGSDCKSSNGIMLFADQEGGYRVDFYNDGNDYVESWYNHLVGYSEWAAKNGYPVMERSLYIPNTICEAFPNNY